MTSWTKRPFLVPLLLCSGVLLLLSPPAHAFKKGSVQAASAPVLDKPGGKSLEVIISGTQVFASDSPVQGYYKVKTPSGKIGYVSAAALSFPGSGAAAPSGTAAPTTSRTSGKRTREKSSGGGKGGFGLRAITGLSLFNVQALNEYIAAEGAYKNGFNVAGEILMKPSQSFGIVLHVESVSKPVQVEVQATGTTLDTVVSSLPVMIGGEIGMSHSDGMDVHFDILAGLGMNTKFAQTPVGGETSTYKGSGVTFLGRLGLELKFGPQFGLHANLGYRLLKATAKPVEPATGDALELNLSGIVANLGASIFF